MTASTPSRVRYLLASVSLTLALVLVTGCAARQPAQRASTPDAVGLWVVDGASAKPATLTELTLGTDGKFRHSGSNALGMPVTFGGTYSFSGESHGGSTLKLVYDDFPDRPTVWFYRLTDSSLVLAPAASGLDDGSGLVLKRAQQQ